MLAAHRTILHSRGEEAEEIIEILGYLYDCEVQKDNPYVYYKLDETSGTTAADSSGNLQHGTITGTPATDSGITLGSPSSIDFDGTNDRVTGVAFPGPLPITVEGWMQTPSTLQTGRVVWATNDRVNGYSGIRCGFSGIAGELYASFGNGGAANASNNTKAFVTDGLGLQPDTNYHFVVVATSINDLKIYVNGVEQATNIFNSATSVSFTSGVIEIGSSNAHTSGSRQYTDITVDRFAVYQSALTEERVQAHYNAGADWKEEIRPVVDDRFVADLRAIVDPRDSDPRDIADPRPLTGFDTAVAALSPYAYYKLDETSGTTAADASGNGRDGTYLETVRNVAAVNYGSDGAQTFVANGNNSGIDTSISVNGWSAITFGGWFVLTGSEFGRLWDDNHGGVADGNCDIRVTSSGNLHVEARKTDATVEVFTHIQDLRDGVAHFVLATWDQNGDQKWRLYLDGALVYTSAVFNHSFTRAETMRVGARKANDGTEFPFLGRLDDAFIFSSALTAAQIADLYLKGRPDDINPHYDDAVVALSPYAHYPLDDLYGTQATDVSGNARHGTYLEKIRPVDAVAFGDGFAQTFIDNGDNSGIDSGINVDGWNAISICAWVDRIDDGSGPLVTNDRDADPTNAWGSVVFGRNRFSLRDAEASEQYSEFLPYAAGIGTCKMFLVGTWDRNGDKKLRSYINGNLIDVSGVFDAALQITPRNLRIGAKHTNSNTPQAWSGSLDAVSIFNRELTATEVADLYQAGKPVLTYDEAILNTNPYAYYKLDETSGPVAVDSSGNSRDGVYQANLETEAGLRHGSSASHSFPDANPSGVDLPFDPSSFTAFTIAGWARCASGEDARLFEDSEFGVDYNSVQLIFDSGGNLVAQTWMQNSNTNRNQIYAPYPQDNTVHFGVATWDRNGDKKLRLYLDGALVVESAAWDFALNPNGNNGMIGAVRATASGSSGQIDSVAIWDHALPAHKIANLYVEGRPDYYNSHYDDLVLSLSPYAHYPLDDLYGTLALDTSGNARHGTYLEKPRPVNDVVYGDGFAQTFINNDENTGIDLGYGVTGIASAYSICAWVKFNSVPADHHFIITNGEHGTTNPSSHIAVHTDDTVKIYFTSQNGPTNDFSLSTPVGTGLFDGKPHLITLTWNDAINTANIYVDGALSASGTWNYSPWSAGDYRIGGNPIPVGQSHGDNILRPFKNDLDALTIFDRALSGPEIKDLYLAGRQKYINSHYDDTVVALSPYAHYPLDELNGTQADDVSGNARHGTYLEKVRPVDGVVYGDGFAQTFVDNDANSGINLGFSSFSNSARSFVSWIQATGPVSNSLYIVSDGFQDAVGGTTHNTVGLAILSDGRPIMLLYDHPTDNTNQLILIGEANLLNGEPHMVACTWDRSVDDVARLYVDGVEIASGTFSHNLWSSTRPFVIGAIDNGDGVAQPFIGSLDAVSIFDRALTDSEIETMYRAGAYQFEFQDYNERVLLHNPYAHYRLDETTGTQATDYSGNDKHGTYVGGVTFGGSEHYLGGLRSADFDGTDDKITLPAIAPDTQTAMTLIAWVKGTSNVDGRIIELSEPLPHAQFYLRKLVDGTARGFFRGGQFDTPIVLTSPAPITDGKEHMVVATYNGSTTGKLYIDGAKVDEDTQPAQSLTTLSTARIGGYEYGESVGGPFERYTGELSGVSVLPGELTADQIEGLYCSGTLWPLTTIESFFPLNDATSGTATDTVSGRLGTHYNTTSGAPLNPGDTASTVFNGVDSYVDCSANLIGDFSYDNGYTIYADFYRDGTGTDPIITIARKDDPSIWIFKITAVGDIIYFDVDFNQDGTPNGTTATVDYSSGRTYRACMIFDPDNLEVRCYINGFWVATINVPESTFSLNPSDHTIELGRRFNTSWAYFTGRMANFRILPNVKTREQYTNNYFAPEAGIPVGDPVTNSTDISDWLGGTLDGNGVYSHPNNGGSVGRVNRTTHSDSFKSAKRYFEVKITATRTGGNDSYLTHGPWLNIKDSQYIFMAPLYGGAYGIRKYEPYGASYQTIYSSSWSTSGAWFGIATEYDAGTRKFWFRHSNGSWLGGLDPGNGDAPFTTITTPDDDLYFNTAFGWSNLQTVTINHGDTAFAHSLPSGFNA